MLQSLPLFKAENEINSASIESNQKFLVKHVLWTTITAKENNDQYTQIVFKVLRNPKHLMSHIQRVYFTYTWKMNSPLYAALIDLLLILDGNGKQLSNRMISLSHSLLSNQQHQTLTRYLQTQDLTLLPENKYTVLTKGLIGSSILLAKKSN
ncbi:MAG: hypothetical protein KAH20_11755 [Methylococcales bacterium]|nr:hypothetical protein [Methylococcales bacterium]